MSDSWVPISRGINDNSDRSRIAWRSAGAMTRKKYDGRALSLCAIIDEGTKEETNFENTMLYAKGTR